MKLNFVLCQTLILVCSFHLSVSIKPRRFFENLGRIHDAIHELSIAELPETEATLDKEKPLPRERPVRRHEERSGRTFNWHKNINHWSLFKFSTQPPNQPFFNEPFRPPPETAERPLRLRLDPRLGIGPAILDENLRPVDRPPLRHPGRGFGPRRGFGKGRRRRPYNDRNYPNNDYPNYPDTFDRPSANSYLTTTAYDEDYYSDNGSNNSYNEEYDQYNSYQSSTSAPVPPLIRSNNNNNNNHPTSKPNHQTSRPNNEHQTLRPNHQTSPAISEPIRSNNNNNYPTSKPNHQTSRPNNEHQTLRPNHQTSPAIPEPIRSNNNNNNNNNNNHPTSKPNHQTSRPNNEHQTLRPNNNHQTSRPNNDHNSNNQPTRYSTSLPNHQSFTSASNNHHSYTTTEIPRVTNRRPIITSTTDNEWDTNEQQIIVKDKSLENAQKICGLRSAPRIVGGRETKPNNWIWMAALIKNDGTNYCGGTLITSYHILTAAHCLEGQIPKDMFVRLGEYDFSKNSGSTAEDHEVEYFIIHNYYDKFTHENDLAILKLKEPAQFTHFIRPVCLPKKRKDYANEIGTVVGYGSSEYGNTKKTGKLREVSVPIWKHDQCQEAYSANFTQGQMCAGFREGGSDSCQGDSGGPLMIINNKSKWEIIGIVSFGIGCGRPGYPGVYTRVNRYLDWIIMNVN